MAVQEIEVTRDAWDAIAAGYDEFVTPMSIPVAEQGLDQVGLEPGMRFLDVAAGSGALSLPAARRGAEVLATDISAAMLERLEARARAEGLAVETRVMDGHRLELDDDTFDVAGSQYGVMLFPDVRRGIHELARVTRPGGRVLMTVFGNPREVEFFSFFVRGIQAAVPDFRPPLDPPPLPFQLRDPAQLRERLVDAGLHAVRVVQSTATLEFRSGDELWTWLQSSNPIPRLILAQLRLAEPQLELVRRTLGDLVRERRGGGDVAHLTAPINIGVGTK